MTTFLFGGVHGGHGGHLSQPCGLQRGHGVDTAWCPVSIKGCFIRLAAALIPTFIGGHVTEAERT